MSGDHIESIENLYIILQKVVKNDEFIKNYMDFIADGYSAEIDSSYGVKSVSCHFPLPSRKLV